MESVQISQSEETQRGPSPAWIAAGVITLLVLGLLGLSIITQSAQLPQIGDPVPNFQLTAFDGSPMDLDGQQGRVVVVNFFASWCAPCRQEAADLEQTWRKYQGQEVQFFGIAYKNAAADAQAFIEEFDVTYPSTADPANRTARDYGVTGVPETFVIDPQGYLVHHFLGEVTQERLSQEIDKALGP